MMHVTSQQANLSVRSESSEDLRDGVLVIAEIVGNETEMSPISIKLEIRFTLSIIITRT